MPKVYGVEHILYLVFVVVIYFIGFWLIKKYVKNEDAVKKMVRIIGLLLFLSILWNRLSIAILRDGWNSFIPGTFCGATSLALSISALTLRKDHPVFHCVVYVGLLGGLLTIIYPDFIGQDSSFFYPMTISGVWHHTVMLFLAIVMIWKGYIIPKLRKWVYLALGLCVYMTFGIFLITVLGYGDAMYIYYPILEGTPLNWIVLGLIFFVYHAIFLGVFEYFRKRKTEDYKKVNL